METIRVNRFKTYRTIRWYRSNYLWSPSNPYLQQYKIQVNEDDNQPEDVLAIPCPHLPGQETFAHRDETLWITQGNRGELDYQDTPIICDSSIDYIYLDPVMRDLLSHPQLRYYLSGVHFRDDTVQQRKSWGGEYYGHAFKHHDLYRCGPDPRPEREPLPAAVCEKIAPLNRPPTPPFSDEVFAYIQSRLRPLREREVDLFFSGRVLYPPGGKWNHPTIHRRLLIDQWDQLPGREKILRYYGNFAGTRYRGQSVRVFKYPYEYVDALLRSKVVVSPWGWSSWCVRDLEALACGCLLIKPECSNTKIYPDIYDPRQQFLVWTDLRFEQLPDQLDYCYTHLDEFQERVDRGRRFVTEALYPNAKVYARWTRDLRRMLEDALSRPNYAPADQIPPPLPRIPFPKTHARKN